MKSDARRGGIVRLGLCVALAIGLAGGTLLPAQQAAGDEQKPPAAPGIGDGMKWGVYEGHGELEVGVRGVTEVAGNKDMYRSMVNLGSGLKLLHSNFSLRSNYGTGGLFDHLDFSMNNWGGDPYSNARVNMGRSGVYELRVNYSNIAYFNFIPTFANPLQDEGYKLGQHSLDTAYRNTDIEFKVLASRHVRPYFGYSRSTGYGSGFTTYAVTANEYLQRTQWHYGADEYRGGVEFVLPRLGFLIEQGMRFVKNDTGVADAGETDGNTQRPFLGEVSRMDSLERGYRDRTHSPFMKTAVKFTPFDFVSLSARYAYASTDVESEMNQISTGNIISLDDRLVFQSAADAYRTGVSKPNHNGSAMLEISPVAGVRFVDQFEVRSFNVTGSGVLESLFYGARPLVNPSLPPSDVSVERIADTYLSYREVRNQGELEFDLGRWLTARGGMRYTKVRTLLEDTDENYVDTRGVEFKRYTGLIGFVFHPVQWLHVAADYENNEPAGGLSRTDLFDYDEFKVDWRAGTWRNMSINGRVSFLKNRNGLADIDLTARDRNYAFAFNYDTERFNVNLDYSRTTLYSNMTIILPATFELDRSVFNERVHGIGAQVGFGLTKQGARFDFGYRGIANEGTFPLTYHQPFASLTIPLQSHLALKSYWQYFGYNEKRAVGLQDYRTHILTLGLAFSR